MSALETYSLQIGYNLQSQNIIAENLNLTLSAGQLVCLLGSNGIGKSTLIRTLVGFQKPISGNIFIEQKSLSSLSEVQLARKIAIVLTNRILVENLTVRDIVAMGRYPYVNMIGRLSTDDWNIVNWAIAKIGIEHLQHKFIVQLSDGERQRVMIAKALAQKTSIIILDEPTAFLDLQGRVAILNLLRDLARTENLAILLSTHDLEQALRLADSLWLMHNCSVVVGCPEDLVISGQLSKVFDTDYLHFDMSDGTFVFRQHFSDSVRIEGDGIEAVWLRRALMRMGCNVNDSAQKCISIEHNPMLTFRINGAITNSIADVLKILALS